MSATTKKLTQTEFDVTITRLAEADLDFITPDEAREYDVIIESLNLSREYVTRDNGDQIAKFLIEADKNFQGFTSAQTFPEGWQEGILLKYIDFAEWLLYQNKKSYAYKDTAISIEVAYQLVSQLCYHHFGDANDDRAQYFKSLRLFFCALLNQDVYYDYDFHPTNIEARIISAPVFMRIAGNYSVDCNAALKILQESKLPRSPKNAKNTRASEIASNINREILVSEAFCYIKLGKKRQAKEILRSISYPASGRKLRAFNFNGKYQECDNPLNPQNIADSRKASSTKIKGIMWAVMFIVASVIAGVLYNQSTGHFLRVIAVLSVITAFVSISILKGDGCSKGLIGGGIAVAVCVAFDVIISFLHNGSLIPLHSSWGTLLIVFLATAWFVAKAKNN